MMKEEGRDVKEESKRVKELGPAKPKSTGRNASGTKRFQPAIEGGMYARVG
jgi:hypothetical protein